MNRLNRVIANLILLIVSLPIYAKQPNVLLILVDDLNADLGSYGHPTIQTPNIDELAKNGLQFNKAFVQATACAPSRTSFLTGLYPQQTGITDNASDFREFIPNVVTLPEHFRNNGYWSARVGKVFHYKVPTDIGTNGHDDLQSWDEVVNPTGIDREVEPQLNIISDNKIGATLSWLSVKSEDNEHTDGKITQAALSLLKKQKNKNDKPFFLSVGYFRPHTPYVAPEKYFDLYPVDTISPYIMPEGDREDIPLAALADRKNQLSLTMKQRKEIIQAYYASISFIDNQVGELLAGIKKLGLDKDTIVVFMSDHGYLLGQHNLWQKGDLFDGSAHTPLIISVPDQKTKGQQSNAIVEALDLYPTLVELAGLPSPKYLQGKSLLPILKSTNTSVRSSAYTTMPSRAFQYYDEMKYLDVTGHSIRTNKFRYTEWGNGAFGVELYDLENDPQEINNLYHNPKYKTSVMKLKRLLNKRKAHAELEAIAWQE
ncbi:sulfatase [Thalassotalea sp. SU-HH00458]|uniref:sulfatase n=1 Tax=Thalassotalea sp. SU-HH00458 TaxID=3127657 RepID=UPI00310A0626